MSVTSDATKDNDKTTTLYFIEQTDIGSIEQELPYRKITIHGYSDLDWTRLLGVVLETEKTKTEIPMLHWDIAESIIQRITFILDAVMVNEKQKKATQGLIESAIYDELQRYRKTFNLAQDFLKNA